MQQLVFDTPYRFIPPTTGDGWPRVLRPFLRSYINRAYGVTDVDFSGLDRLRESIGAGHGIMLAPNHARACDPMILGMLTRHMPRFLYPMASWHLFQESRLQHFFLRRLGAFSIYREGADKAAVQFAVQSLIDAKRMLVVFPEGAVTRANDYLHPLQEGTALIARMAAKKRAKQSTPGEVVVHPVGIRHYFLGDVEAALHPILRQLEDRFCMHLLTGRLNLVERINHLEEVAIATREVEAFGAARSGPRAGRLAELTNSVLEPLEQEWPNGKHESEIAGRVKRLRSAILPAMIRNEVTDKERARSWRHLTQLYYVHQLAFFRSEPLASDADTDDLVAVAQRLEEDLTDRFTVLRPWRVKIEIAPALAVSSDRGEKSRTDPLMEQIRASLQDMLDRHRRPTQVRESSTTDAQRSRSVEA